MMCGARHTAIVVRMDFSEQAGKISRGTVWGWVGEKIVWSARAHGRIKHNAPFGTFTPLTALLYTAPVPCSSSLSPSTQRSSTFAPSTHSSTSFFITLFTMSAAVCTGAPGAGAGIRHRLHTRGRRTPSRRERRKI